MDSYVVKKGNGTLWHTPMPFTMLSLKMKHAS